MDERIEVSEVAALRDRLFTQASCEWDDHQFKQVFVLAPHPFVLLVLCVNCGRDPGEALAALPIVVPDVTYPDPKKGRSG